MDKIYKAVIRTKASYLVHYNHNHDKLGRFAKSNGVNSSMRQLDPNTKEGKAFIKEGKRAIAKAKLGEAYKKLKNTSPSDLFYDTVNKIDKKKRDDKVKAELTETDKKNIILDNDIPKFTKNHQLKSVKGDVYVDHGYDMLEDRNDYNVVGESSSKVWKEEVRSKNGVHIIQTHPTTIDFGDVASDKAPGIDRNKLKKLDSFAKTKKNNQAIYAGRDLVANPPVFVDGVKQKTKPIGKYTPKDIVYGFGEKGEPKVKRAYYINERTKDVYVVEFDDNSNPVRASVDYYELYD